MHGPPLSMLLLSSVLTFAAAFLAAKWIGPAWDAVAQRHIGDISPRLHALNMDESDVGTWMRGWGVAMFLAMFVFGVVLGMPPVAAGVTFLVFISPRFILDQMIKRRQIKLRDQLVRSSMSVANGCRAGLSLTQSFERAAAETKEPMSSELRRVVRDNKAGRPLVDALRELQLRLDLESFTVFSSSVIVALERGGKVTDALERISEGLQEMQRLERKLEADSAAGRKLATILSLFPLGLLAMFTLLDPENTGYLYGTLLGQFILLGIGTMVFGAAKWCMMILDIDF